MKNIIIAIRLQVEVTKFLLKHWGDHKYTVTFEYEE